MSSSYYYPPHPPQPPMDPGAVTYAAYAAYLSQTSNARAMAASTNTFVNGLGGAVVSNLRTLGGGGGIDFFRGRGGGRRVGFVVGRVMKPKRAVDYRSLYSQAGKSIVPRPASVVLNDMVGFQVIYSYHQPTEEEFQKYCERFTKKYFPRSNRQLHTCRVTINGETYSGTAPSRKEARERCAETAVPTIVFQKLQEQKVKGRQLDERGRPLDFEKQEDETPWASLCSLAVHKMLQDWISEGVEVPAKLFSNFASPENSGVSEGIGRIISEDQSINGEGIPQIQIPDPTEEQLKLWKEQEAITGKRVPQNPTSRNPLQLLNEIRHDVNFSTIEVGEKPHSYATTMKVGDLTFTGEAMNKKQSKYNCALQMLKTLYGIEYPDSTV